MQRARERFYHMSGAGAGAKYWDSANRYVVTAINVADWIYQQTPDHERDNVPTPMKLGNMGWQSVTPDPVFKIKAPAVVNRKGIRSVNAWYDNGVDASAYQHHSAEEITANAEPFLTLLRAVLCKREDWGQEGNARVDFLVDWLRFVFQHSGQKPPCAPYTYGPHGWFKGTVMDAVKVAMGSLTARTIGEDNELVDKNNHEVMQCALAMVEEVRPQSHDGTAVYNALKHLVTSRSSFSSAKHKGFEERELPASLWLSSNHAPPFLEQGDRRFWVIGWGHDIDQQPSVLPETEGWKQEWKSMLHHEFTNWLQNEDGYAKLRAFLEYVPTTYTPMDAPDTPEKMLALGLSERSAVRKLRDAVEDSPYGIFPADTIANLLDLANPDQAKHVAIECGLVPTSLKTLAPEANDPTIKDGKTRLLRGNELFFLKAGWKLRRKSSGWEVSGVDSDGTSFTDHPAKHVAKHTEVLL